MIFSVVSLSVLFGMPIAGLLRHSFPQISKWIWFCVGIGAGFLILRSLYRLLELAVDWWMRKR